MKMQRPVEIRIGSPAEVISWYYQIIDAANGRKPIKEIWSLSPVQEPPIPGIMTQPQLSLLVSVILVFNPDKKLLES